MSKVVVTRNRKLNAVEKNRSPISKTTAGVTFTTKREDHEADLILVYKLSDSLNRPKRETFKEYFEKVLQLVVSEVSRNSDFVFIRVHAPIKCLQDAAETIRIRKILPVQNEQKTSFLKIFRLPQFISDETTEYYTVVHRYHDKEVQGIFQSSKTASNFYITPTERIALTYQLLAHQDKTKMDDSKKNRWRGIDKSVNSEIYVTYFPLHQKIRANFRTLDDSKLNDREKLRKYWATKSALLKFQPIQLVRSYFGEKLAFYFAFAGYYTMTLIPAVIAGLIVFIYGAASFSTDPPTSEICGSFGSTTYMCPRCDKVCPFWQLSDNCPYAQASFIFDNTGTLVFATIMAFWARWFVEYWKQQEATLRYNWDSMDFDENVEPVLSSYEKNLEIVNKQRTNPFNGKQESYLGQKEKLLGYIPSILFVILMALIIGSIVLGTIVYRVQIDYLLRKTSARNVSSIIVTVTSAIINLIITLPLTRFYYWLARQLTNYEYHKYKSSFEDSMTMKLYLFQFANFYSSLFYVAFFKGRFSEYPSTYGETGASDFKEQCEPGGCILELTIQLATIMIGQQIANNFVEIFTAFCCTTTFCPCVGKRADHDDQWEKEYEMIDITHEFLFDEYLELVIQFGFVTLFAVAFPLAPLFALLNNLIELRLDAWKFLMRCRRPIPQKASDIGIWNTILSAISYLSVLTNGAIIAWTSEFIPRLTYSMGYTTNRNLQGYVDWTLSSFPIADYNRTGLMYPYSPSGITYCRYRDFRESTGPSYSLSFTYWHVVAARLAFMVAFEHFVVFIVFVIQQMVSDVPTRVKERSEQQRDAQNIKKSSASGGYVYALTYTMQKNKETDNEEV